MTEIYFPGNYRNSRAKFQGYLDVVKQRWPAAISQQQFISEEDDLSIDWIDADPGRQKDKVLLITTGLHGVEGYVGAGMLDLFISEMLQEIDPADTGLVLIHALNPWGMENFRRFNRNNVDLNRNFMDDPQDFEMVFNPNYLKLDRILNPRRPLRVFWQEDIRLILTVLINLIRYGVRSLREAVLLGQQSNPAGLYFAGRAYQAETIWMRKLVGDILSNYNQVVHLDMHTGYGPSDLMSLVISPSEPRSSGEISASYQYPRVVKADPEQFYSMQGDMVDWIYRLRDKQFPEVELFSAAFEFGTYGSGIPKEILSLRTMIYLNQAEQQGTVSESVLETINAEFTEMFFPAASSWRKKAAADARRALRGILEAEGYL